MDVAQQRMFSLSCSGCASTTTPLSPGTAKTGFYGVDLYSLHRSIEAVIAYLDKVDPEAGQRARARYGCFDDFGDNPQIYGQMVSLGMAEDCENEVVGQLVLMQRRAHELGRGQ